MTESDKYKYKQAAYKTFAKLHPVEAFAYDNAKFMKLLKEQGYDLTIKEVKQIIKKLE